MTAGDPFRRRAERRRWVIRTRNVSVGPYGEAWHRGPAPHHFVTVPDEESEQLLAVSAAVSYGSGMIPVNDAVRRAEGLADGDTLTVRLTVSARG